MATRTRGEMIAWLLGHIGVKAASQAARAEDSDSAGRLLDSVYDRLHKKGLAPFPLSSVPEWAQQPLVDVAAPELAPPFLIGGERLAKLEAGRDTGLRELAEQVAAKIHETPAQAEYF